MSSDCIRCSLCVLDCPTFTWSGDETRTMRGRRLALDAGVPKPEIAETMDGCIACAACDPVCPKDLDNASMVLDLIAAAPAGDPRKAAAGAMAESIDRNGNPFGRPEPGIEPRRDGPILLWLGCVLRTLTPRLIPSVLAACDRAGLRVMVRSDEGCCGWPLLRSGDPAGADRHLRRLADSLSGVESIVTPCAACLDHLRARLASVGRALPVHHLATLLDEAGVLPLPDPGDLVQWPSHLLNRHHAEFHPLAERLASLPGTVDGRTPFRYTQDLGEDFPAPHEGIVRRRLADLRSGPRPPRRIVTLCPTTQSLLDGHPEIPSRFFTERLPDGHPA